MSFILAIEIGAAALKGALMGRDGLAVGLKSAAIETPPADGGYHELDALKWWRALIEVVEAIGKEQATEFAAIEAVGIAGLSRGLAFIDADGQAARPALLPTDLRAAPKLAELSERLARSNGERRHVDALHPAARLYALQQDAPAGFDRIHKVLTPKDYLAFRLTGAAATDRCSGARLHASIARQAHERTIFEAAGLPAAIVPETRPPATILGRIKADLPGRLGWLQGKPIVTMGDDVWTAAAGLGALTPGVAFNYVGVSESLFLSVKPTPVSQGLTAMDWDEERSLIGGASQVGADTARWFLELFRTPDGSPRAAQAVVESLVRARRHPDPLIFLPYLQGEKAPHWDPSLRGSFIGLSREHGPGDMFRAVIEGAAFVNRLILERTEKVTGVTAGELRMGGPFAGNTLWRQVKADALNRPVIAPDVPNPALLGICVAARTALGEYHDIGAAQKRLVPAGARTAPDPAKRGFYDQLFQLFQQADSALAPLSQALAGWGKAT